MSICPFGVRMLSNRRQNCTGPPENVFINVESICDCLELGGSCYMKNDCC